MTLAQLEADLRHKREAIDSKIKTTMEAAAKDNDRAFTAEERAALDALTADARALVRRIDGLRGDQAVLAEIDRVTAGMTAAGPVAAAAAAVAGGRRLSLGAQFVQDPGYRAFIQAGGHRRSASSWASPAVEVLYGTTLDTSPGSGGALITPDVRPGVVALPQMRPVVGDLPAPGTTTSGIVQYMKEKTFTNAAAPVAEGQPKPESALVFESATSPVQKLAHWIPTSEEMLEDYAQTESIIDSRLRLGLALTEEDQLMNGDGIAPNLLGYLNLPGLAPPVPRGTDTNIDAIFKQIAAIATSALITPDGVVINPANWATIQISKNSQGNYLGSGPFAGPQAPTLWGVSVVPTPVIVAGTSLVGAYRSASQLFRKGGVRVEASNSHADFFIRNLVAIRGEERLALAVYREGAFGTVTGLQ